jgi:hypothetical protein
LQQEVVMPGKTITPVNASGFWEFLAIMGLLFLGLSLASGAPKNTVPVVGVQPTSISSASMIGSALINDASVLVIPTNNNQFDKFDINEVVTRISDPSGANQDLPKEATGTDDQFKVSCPSGKTILVWAPGYEVKSGPCNNQETIYLPHLDAFDNTNYIWAFATIQCNECHGNQLLSNPQTGASYDEMNEWFRSGHAKVFNGGYFESMYNGTSRSGKPSIRAQPVIIDNEWVPVPPEKSQDYHGPGFKLDYPGQPGNCVYCHVPASISASQQSMDLSFLFPNPGGSWGEGVTCDVCHKVFSVTLADNRFPFPDRPGILSYRFLRPNSGAFIIGPFSNLLKTRQDGSSVTVNHRLTCAPIFGQSEFCAPCHFGKFGDMVVYNSFGEWKESPYAANPLDPAYRTCQDCHMSHLYKGERDSLSSERQACSANNTRFQNFDHNMMDFGPPGSQVQIPLMVKDAAQIGVTFGTQAATTNTLDVNVSVTNTRAGHKFPTDSPLRHLILVVTAVDRVNTPLIQVGGDRIPKWAGPGPISPISIADNLMKAGILDYGGMPGRIFANLLVEEETNLSPGMAYWNETKYASVDSASGATSDTRLNPWQTNTSTYSFEMPDAGDVRVTAQLLYRFAFYDLMVWKEWYDRPDILVAAMECNGPPRDLAKMSCQLVDTPTP